MFVWNDDVSDRVLRAQEDEEYLNEFIKENKRFILMKAFQSVKHFVSESDDEWSIAMIAFHEAVHSYDVSKGNFRAFAGLVIKRRLTDYVIGQLRHQAEIPVEADDMDGDGEQGEEMTPLQLEVRSKMVELSEQGMGGETPGSTPIRDEIEAVQELLRPYGFTFFDLTECSPKTEKTKKACAQAVTALLRDPALFEKMRTSHTLPMKELIAASGVQKKLLERHRRYIIAAAEIMNGEYPLLREYMAYIRKALET